MSVVPEKSNRVESSLTGTRWGFFILASRYGKCKVCWVLRLPISKPFGSTASGGGYRIALSTNQNGQYGNKTKFYLYVPKDYVETNVQKFDLYQRCLILCYGEIEFYNDTPQMKIYSLSSQMVRGLTFPKQQ